MNRRNKRCSRGGELILPASCVLSVYDFVQFDLFGAFEDALLPV